MELIIGLVSGLIGSVIGAWATLRASEKSLTGLYKQDLEKREFERLKRSKAILQSILKELEENIEIVTDVLEHGNYKVRMSRDAWNAYRGEISFMTEALQIKLPKIYHMIASYNGLIEYDLYKLSHGAGYVDDKIRTAAESFKKSSESMVDQLETLSEDINQK